MEQLKIDRKGFHIDIKINEKYRKSRQIEIQKLMAAYARLNAAKGGAAPAGDGAGGAGGDFGGGGGDFGDVGGGDFGDDGGEDLGLGDEDTSVDL